MQMKSLHALAVISALSRAAAFNVTSPIPGEIWDATVPNFIRWTWNSTDPPNPTAFIGLSSNFELPLGVISSDAGFYQVTPNSSLPLGGYTLLILLGAGFLDLPLGSALFNLTDPPALGGMAEFDFSISTSVPPPIASGRLPLSSAESTATSVQSPASASLETARLSTTTSQTASGSTTSPTPPALPVKAPFGLSGAATYGLGIGLGFAVTLLLIFVIILVRRKARRRPTPEAGVPPPAYSETLEDQDSIALIPLKTKA